jgi:Ca-activated chloride channel family protein
MDDAMVARLRRAVVASALWQQLAAVSAIAVIALFIMNRGDGEFIDLWLTPDQQGRLAYERLEFPESAELFTSPEWKGVAQYRSGQYVEAADTFARIDSAVGFYNRGNAFLRGFEYRKAITAYETAVAEAPEWIEAQENLELARYTLDYIERAREQGDTGEEAGIGADDVVYDNEGERGTDTQVSRESAVEAQSAEKWMRSVNTETADFLRSRFLLEAARKDLL